MRRVREINFHERSNLATLGHAQAKVQAESFFPPPPAKSDHDWLHSSSVVGCRWGRQWNVHERGHERHDADISFRWLHCTLSPEYFLLRPIRHAKEQSVAHSPPLDRVFIFGRIFQAKCCENIMTCNSQNILIERGAVTEMPNIKHTKVKCFSMWSTFKTCFASAGCVLPSNTFRITTQPNNKHNYSVLAALSVGIFRSSQISKLKTQIRPALQSGPHFSAA